MWGRNGRKQGDRLPQNTKQAFLREAVTLILIQADHQRNRRWSNRVRPQYTNTARLYQPRNSLGNIGNHLVAFACQTGAVVGNQPRAKRHQLQGQR